MNLDHAHRPRRGIRSLEHPWLDVRRRDRGGGLTIVVAIACAAACVATDDPELGARPVALGLGGSAPIGCPVGEAPAPNEPTFGELPAPSCEPIAGAPDQRPLADCACGIGSHLERTPRDLGHVLAEKRSWCECDAGLERDPDLGCVLPQPAAFRAMVYSREVNPRFSLGAVWAFRGHDELRAVTIASDQRLPWAQTQQGEYDRYQPHWTSHDEHRSWGRDIVWTRSDGMELRVGGGIGFYGGFAPAGATTATSIAFLDGWFGHQTHAGGSRVICTGFDVSGRDDDSWNDCVARSLAVVVGADRTFYTFEAGMAWAHAASGTGVGPDPGDPQTGCATSGCPAYQQCVDDVCVANDAYRQALEDERPGAPSAEPGRLQCDTYEERPACGCDGGVCDDPLASWNRGGSSAGEPVELRFGTFYEDVPGLATPTEGPALETDLQYSSLLAASGLELGAGPGWRVSYTRHLRHAPSAALPGVVFLVDESGRSSRYVETDVGTGIFVLSAAANSSQAVRDATTGEWTVYRREGAVERYAPDGRLRSVADRLGRVLTLDRRVDGDLLIETLASGSGAALERIYRTLPGGSDRLVEVRDAAASAGGAAVRVVRFDYDAGGRLNAATYPTGARIGFGYDQAGRMVRVEDANYDAADPEHGPLLNTYVGDTARIARQVMSNGLTIDFAWQPRPPEGPLAPDARTLQVTYTEPDGTVHTRGFLHDARGRIVREYVPDTADRYEARHYDAVTGLLTRVVDPAGVETTWTYDHDMLDLRAAVTAPGTPAEARWRFLRPDPFGQPTEIVDPTGRRQTLVYDEQGKLLTQTLHGDDGTTKVSRFEYDAAQRLVRVIEKDGFEARLTYGPRGQVSRLILGSGPTAVVETYEHDARGVLTRMIGGDGAERVFETDLAGRVTAVVLDPTGAAERTAYEYDRRGNLSAIVEPDGARWQMEYVEAGDVGDQPRLVVDPTGAVERWRYDALGLPSMKANLAPGELAPRTTTFARSSTPEGIVSTTTFADGSQTLETTDAAGKPRSRVDARGVTTRWEYDAAGRVTRELHGAAAVGDAPAIGAATTWAYDAAGRVVSVLGPDGERTTFQYDGFGDLVQVEDGAGRRRRRAWDPVARTFTETSGSGAEQLVRRTALDDAGRVISATLEAAGAAQVTRYEYAAAGNRVAPVAVIDPTGRRTELGYDGRGRHVSTRAPDGGLVTFVRDHRGAVLDELGPQLRHRSARFDALGRLVERRERAGTREQVESWRWGPFATPVRYVAADGAIIDVRHDRVGRVIGIDDDTDDVDDTVFDYLPNGLLRQMVDREGTTEYAYDAANRLTARVRDGLAVRYTRRPGGQVTSVDYFGAGDVDIDYGADGLVASLRPFGHAISYARDSLGRVSTVGDDTASTSIVHGAGGGVTAISYTAAGASLETITGVRDLAGRLTSVVDAAGAHAFGYDQSGRLVTADHPPGADVASAIYAYDVRGNRVAANGVSRTHAADDRIDGLVYDAAGRLLDDGTSQFRYDHLGRHVGTTRGGHAYEYRHDGLGRMVGVVVDGQQHDLVLDEDTPLPRVLAVVSPSAARLFAWGPEGLAAIREGARVTRALPGLDGGPRHHVDVSGDVETDRYDDWGVAMDAPACPAATTTVVANASKTYAPSQVNRFQHAFDPSAEVVVPSELPVVTGNAGNHFATLRFASQDGRTLTLCYRGGASTAHPSTATQIARGQRYVFHRATYDSVVCHVPTSGAPAGVAPGDTVTGVRGVTLDLHGDSWSPAGAPRTEIRVELTAAVASTCAPDWGPGFQGAWGNPDETVYMNARTYLPRLGVFLQPDRFAGFGDILESMNRYSFAWNDPVNRLDPSGRSPRRELPEPIFGAPARDTLAELERRKAIGQIPNLRTPCDCGGAPATVGPDFDRPPTPDARSGAPLSITAYGEVHKSIGVGVTAHVGCNEPRIDLLIGAGQKGWSVAVTTDNSALPPNNYVQYTTGYSDGVVGGGVSVLAGADGAGVQGAVIPTATVGPYVIAGTVTVDSVDGVVQAADTGIAISSGGGQSNDVKLGRCVYGSCRQRKPAQVRPSANRRGFVR